VPLLLFVGGCWALMRVSQDDAVLFLGRSFPIPATHYDFFYPKKTRQLPLTNFKAPLWRPVRGFFRDGIPFLFPLGIGLHLLRPLAEVHLPAGHISPGPHFWLIKARPKGLILFKPFLRQGKAPFLIPGGFSLFKAGPRHQGRQGKAPLGFPFRRP